MKIYLVAVFFILLAFFPTAQAEDSEHFNGTTYYLYKSEAEVIQPVNGTSFNLTLPTKSEVRLFDYQGEEVPVETKVQFWRGSYNYRIVSQQPVEGHLNYTQPIHEQRLIVTAKPEEPVRVVLPSGYATGDSALGKARPSPDEVKEEDGRMVLIWDSPQEGIIQVRYYKKEAPWAFRMFLLLLLFLAGVLGLEYTMSIKRLKSIREEVDKDR